MIRWSRLSLRARITVLIALQAVLLVLVATAIVITQTSIRQQVRTIIVNTDEAAFLVRSLQFQVDELDRIETALLEEFDNSSEVDMASQYRTAAEAMRGTVEDLDTLLVEVGSAEAEAELETAITSFDTTLDRKISVFETIAELVDQATEPQVGVFALLQSSGDRLSTLVSLQANNLPGSTTGSELTAQLIQLRAIERRLIEDGTEEDFFLLEESVNAILDVYNTLPEADQIAGLQDAANQYLANGEAALALLSDINEQAAQLSIEASTFSRRISRLSNIVDSIAQEQQASIEPLENRALVTLVVTLLAAISVSGVLIGSFGSSVLNGLDPLLAASRELETGNLKARAHLPGEGEFAELASSFNSMAVQLEGLVGSLEERVAERTRDLTITAEIGRAVVAQRDPRSLMNEIVELVRERFNFYHAQVFIVDDAGVNANLVASTGNAGRELLSRRHSLPVGSQSVIGQVTARAQPVVALDTSTDPTHKVNELLPDTRAEMALPMRIGDQVIGALDVQSVSPNVFNEDTVAVFQIMADQLAVALENARLYNELADAHARIEGMQRRITRDMWRDYQRQREREGASLQITSGAIVPYEGDASPLIEEAIARGQLVHRRNGEGHAALAIPIKVNDETIGALGFTGSNLDDLNEEDLKMVEAIMERVELALENQRLVEQTSRRAEYEQIVNEITAQIVGSTDVNHILQTTVRQLGRILGAPQTTIQLRRGGE